MKFSNVHARLCINACICVCGRRGLIKPSIPCASIFSKSIPFPDLYEWNHSQVVIKHMFNYPFNIRHYKSTPSTVKQHIKSAEQIGILP